MSPTLSHARLRALYDRLGRAQDAKAGYEKPAIGLSIAHGAFGSARSVVELGCGTGAFAERLLRDALPSGARYLALDLSATMTGLAAERLRPWSGRALAVRTGGPPRIPAPDGAFDRFVSNYVFDLLSEADITFALAEARRVLTPGGLLCLSGLAPGRSPLTRATTMLWRAVHAISPARLGGCRPIELRPRLDSRHWEIRFHAAPVAGGLASEVLIARRRENSPM